jgi:hypothetical protein
MHIMLTWQLDDGRQLPRRNRGPTPRWPTQLLQGREVDEGWATEFLSSLCLVSDRQLQPTQVKLLVRLGDVEASYVSCARSSDVKVVGLRPAYERSLGEFLRLSNLPTDRVCVVVRVLQEWPSAP